MISDFECGMIVGGITTLVAFTVILLFLKHKGVFLDFTKISNDEKKE